MMTTSFSFKDAREINQGVYSTSLEGLYYLPHKVFSDNRGFYAELTRIPEIETVIDGEFRIKQLNLAMSQNRVSRGFHAENWNKLVTVTSGTCFTALADVRPESDTFGQVETFLFGQGENQLSGSLFVSSGIANSLCVVNGPVYYLYGVDQLYKDRDTSNDVAISLFDPDLDVNWPTNKEEMIVSERDLNAITLREKYPEKF